MAEQKTPTRKDLEQKRRNLEKLRRQVDDALGSGAKYQRHKERSAKRQAAQAKADQDCARFIPPLADPERRERCRNSLRAFCETYNPEAFNLEWSDDHLRAIARIEEAVWHGALYAFAMPRGSGKTAICRMAALWAVSYAHCRYVFVIGANAEKAQATLYAVKTWLRFLSRYAADFPEISGPIQHLGGTPQKAGGQHCDGEPTMIHWGQERVVLPTAPAPANWPESWARGNDGLAPTSGTIIGVSGLTGEGIRGSVHTLTSGAQVRPDLVLLDDPQTDESARSPSQNVEREQLVSGAVLGMSGPDKQISAVMPCTVIRPDDFVDRVLDRKKHPMWRGERTKMMRSMPSKMGEWEKYFEVYQECALKEPPDFSESNDYYRKRQAKLEEGAEPSWPARKYDGELTATQHAMHLWFRSPAAFAAEYQNEPEDPSADDEFPTAEEIKHKVSGIDRARVPPKTSRLTSFVDVQDRMLYWAVCAWWEGFGGQVIDYGAYPDQKRTYYRYTEATNTLARKHPKAGREGAIYAGLVALIDALIGGEWKGVDKASSYRIERCLIDAGHEKGLIYDVCRDSKHAAVLTPAFGRGIQAGNMPMSEWRKEPGEERGHAWCRRTAKGEGVRYVLTDVNTWKTKVMHALGTPAGDPGSLALYKAKPAQHQMIADHLTAETPQRTEGRGRELVEWKLVDRNRDNHLLDCVVGCMVAASMAGIRGRGDDEPKGRRKPQRERKRLSEMQGGRR